MVLTSLHSWPRSADFITTGDHIVHAMTEQVNEKANSFSIILSMESKASERVSWTIMLRASRSAPVRRSAGPATTKWIGDFSLLQTITISIPNTVESLQDP
jgi:hypothetical protein